MDYDSTMQTILDIQTIKNGGTADLSLAQITFCIINLQDAEQKLSHAEFEKIHSLFLQYLQKTTKTSYNISSYTETAISIIRSFDAIAPYELYSGGDPQECSAFLKEIRQNNTTNSTHSAQPDATYAPSKEIQEEELKNLRAMLTCAEQMAEMRRNALRDLNGVELADVYAAYKAGILSYQRFEEIRNAIEALNQILSLATPEYIRELQDRYIAEYNRLSSKYDLSLFPASPFQRRESTTYAPPKKMGFSFWLILLAAVGAVIAVAIYFNR